MMNMRACTVYGSMSVKWEVCPGKLVPWTGEDGCPSHGNLLVADTLLMSKRKEAPFVARLTSRQQSKGRANMR